VDDANCRKSSLFLDSIVEGCGKVNDVNILQS